MNKPWEPAHLVKTRFRYGKWTFSTLVAEDLQNDLYGWIWFPVATTGRVMRDLLRPAEPEEEISHG